jgi:putative ABC transport system substrate-binding protein
MKVFSSKRVSDSCSDNRQSKTCSEHCRRIQNRKWLGLSVIAFVLMVPGAVVHAQQPKKMPRIGYLSTQEPARDSARSEAIRLALRQRGYIEGKNIVIEDRYADGKADRASELVAELVRLQVDVIFANSTTIALVAKNATKTIPIVFLSQAEPVASGLVDSLARPGGNLTGFATIAAVLAGKRLELLKETIPKLSRVGVLWEPKNPGSEESWKESQLAARQLGLKIHSIEVSSPDKFESAFSVATKARSDALAVTLSGLFSSHQKLIVSLAAKRRIPAIYTREEFVDKGGLMSYGADDDEPFKRIAMMIDKIVKGAKPADLPVEQPTKFEFVINLKAAKQIGLTIPPNVLARADKVIR